MLWYVIQSPHFRIKSLFICQESQLWPFTAVSFSARGAVPAKAMPSTWGWEQSRQDEAKQEHLPSCLHSGPLWKAMSAPQYPIASAGAPVSVTLWFNVSLCNLPAPRGFLRKLSSKCRVYISVSVYFSFLFFIFLVVLLSVYSSGT
jgi:hypothetical protein